MKTEQAFLALQSVGLYATHECIVKPSASIIIITPEPFYDERVKATAFHME